MRIKRRAKTIAFAATLLVVGAGASVVIVDRSATPASVPAAATGVPVTGWLATPAIQRFSAADSIGHLSVLVSAGNPEGGANGLAVVSGTNAAGAKCWTIVQLGGAIGSAFRCGTPIGSGVGDPSNDKLRVVCQTSGGSGSRTADSAGCLGFVGADVASVAVELADGSSQTLPVTQGAFAYAAELGGKLPKAFTAYDGSGDVAAQESVDLASGLGSG